MHHIKLFNIVINQLDIYIKGVAYIFKFNIQMGGFNILVSE